MREDEVYSKINRIIVDQGHYLGIDGAEALAKDQFFDEDSGGPEGLDSLASISLAVELEEVFEITPLLH